MTTSNIPRVQAGVPDGGQFAARRQAESNVDLSAQPTPRITPAQFPLMLAERNRLRQEAADTQASADAIEMQLIAHQLGIESPNATHVYVMDPSSPRHATVELYTGLGGSCVNLAPRSRQPQDNDVASRLIHLAANRDSTFRAMMAESDTGDGMGVPIGRLARAGKEDLGRRAERLTATEKAREKVVSDAVLAAVPDAVAWSVRTTEWDNGYFYTPDELVALRGNGSEVPVDVSEINDGELYQELESTLLELSDGDGPLGERQTHDADIDREPTPQEQAAAAERAATEKAREKAGGDAVLTVVPDAASWTVGTVEWDNGYFYAQDKLVATRADGTEALVDVMAADPDNDEPYLDLEATLLNLSSADGPLGEHSHHDAHIDRPATDPAAT